jgi:hypothetical protein
MRRFPGPARPALAIIDVKPISFDRLQRWHPLQGAHWFANPSLSLSMRHEIPSAPLPSTAPGREAHFYQDTSLSN